MLNKGNVLQYKANSSNLTKAQRYSKIAKGQWTNRNTTWATQSTRGYTNPNSTSLKRGGNVENIAIDPITGAIIGPTTAPPTCPKTVVPINEGLPSNSGGGSIEEPIIPPPVEPTPASDTFPPIIPETPVEPIVIRDGGNLICSIQENICTGETKRSLSQQLCNPTTDSDVPGTIQDLCWNDGTPTWYPRSNYTMNGNGSWNSYNIDLSITNNNNNNNNLNNDTYSHTDNCYELNKFINSSIIVKIIKLYTEYNTNIKDVKNNTFGFSLTDYNDYKIALENLNRTLNNNCISKLIPIFLDILKSIYYGSILASNYITEINNGVEYKLAYDILHDPQKLQEYLNEQSKIFTALPPVNITAPKANLKPQYQIYISLYGLPPDLEFEPSKLTDIVNSINLYNNKYGIPVDNDYDITIITNIKNGF
jgi:hypothetical protein